MYLNGIVWLKWRIITNLSLMILFARLILIVDCVRPGNPSASRQMCAKLQSMLSFGKYQTSQISSNVTYVSRYYAQNFLAYSSMDDLLIFIEPKLQIHVYNAQTIQSLVNLTTTDIVIATSTTSLISDSRHELFFIYETHSSTNLISLNVCQVRFDIFQLNFEKNFCIETINIQYDRPDLRINGFIIKRDHAGTRKSLLFISTDIGLIYSVFDTRMGSIIGESTILNETLNDGSIVLTSSNTIYYASKQEHLIYELHIQRDFRLRYGNIIKTNAIKYPFGLITDECNHLYIATRSMILVMYMQNRATIRSVFSKASDLPITLERLNSTTYVYTTVRKNAAKTANYWMFNFLYFTDPDKVAPISRHPVTNWEEKLDFNGTRTDNVSIAILWPLSYPLAASHGNTTKKYVLFTSAPRKSSSRFQKKKKKDKPRRPAVSVDQDISSLDENNYSTLKPSDEQTITELSDDFRSNNPDENRETDENLELNSEKEGSQSLDNNLLPDTDITNNRSLIPSSSPSNLPIDDRQNILKEKENFTSNQHSISNTSSIEPSSNTSMISKHSNTTSTISSQRMIEIAGTLFSEDEIQSFLEGRGNLTSSQQAQIQAYLADQPPSGDHFLAKYFQTTSKPRAIITSVSTLLSENQSINEDASSQARRPKQPLPDDQSRNRTINITGTLFSEDEIYAYLEGRGNLTLSEETQIRAYLTRLSSSNNTILSKYLTKIKTPVGIFISDDHTESTSTESNNTSTNRDAQPPDSILTYLKFINRTINIADTIFTEEDVRSYLQGRANLSAIQVSQLQAYLAQKLSSSGNISSNYSTSTKKPRGTFKLDDGLTSQQQTNGSLSSDSSELHYKPFNHTTDPLGRIFSNEELQSYLEGRSNLSRSEQAQIEAYLAKQSSLDYSSFSSFSKTTTRSAQFLPSDARTVSESEKDQNSLLNHDSQFQSNENLPIDSKSSNRTIDIAGTLFTEDEIQSYFEGRGNLTSSQEAQIRAYLAEQSSWNNTIFSKYSKNIQSVTGVFVSRNNTESKFQDDYNSFQNYSTKHPEHFDHVFDWNGTLISNDELQSYLEGRSNLSASQETLIQAYLARQSSSFPNIFSRYSKSTTKPDGTMLPNEKSHTNSSINAAFTFDEELQLEAYLKYLNSSTNSSEILFSYEDFKSYLHGNANISVAQEAQIRAYLAKQPSLFYNLLTQESTSTRKPRRTSISNRDTWPEYVRKGNLSRTNNSSIKDYSEELLPFDLTSDNRSTNTDGIFFSEEEVQSYLQGRANLSLAREAQIQTYLAKQSLSSYNPSSKYTTSTRKPRRISIPSRGAQSKYQRKGNLSLTKDYSEELLPSDLKPSNRTTDTEEILFSDDDLRSYLEGRANLSKSQEAEIEAYLSRPSSSYQNIFARYSNRTKSRARIINGSDSITQLVDQNGDPQSKNHSEELLFSEDDLQSYIQGRANLSQAQEAQIQAYLSKQTSLDNDTFSKFRTTTRKPTKTFTSDEILQFHSKEQTDRSSNDQIQSSDATSQKFTSTKSYTTRRRTGRRRLTQSVTNGTDDFSTSMKQFSDPSLDQATKATLSHPLATNANQTSTDSVAISQRIPSSQNQSNLIDTSKVYDDMNNNIQNEISHKHSSPSSVTINISSTLHPLPSLGISSTTLSSSRRSRSPTPLHYSLVSRSTKSRKFTRPSSSKLFSETEETATATSVSSEIASIDSKPTTVLSYSTIFPSFSSKSQSSRQLSSMQTTDTSITSKISTEKPIITLSDVSSISPLLTTYRSRFRPITSSKSPFTTVEQWSTTKSNRYTSKSVETRIQTSPSSSLQSTRTFTTLFPSTNRHFSSTKLSDSTLSRSVLTSTDKENLANFANQPLKTTETLSSLSVSTSSLTDKYLEGLISTERLIDIPSTAFPLYSESTTLSPIEQTTFNRIRPSTESTLPMIRQSSYSSTTTTTTRRFRTRKQKTIPWQAQLSTTTITTSSTTTAIPFYLATTVHDHDFTTSIDVPIWYSEWNPLEQQDTIVIKPSSNNNHSNPLLTNDLLNQIFNNFSTSTNSSEKSIFFNLVNYPASSWNLSLNTNESVTLDVALPKPIFPSSSSTATNLTFTNIEANRFSTNIIGVPINLQVDRVQTRQFSLTMNTTDDQRNRNGSMQHFSDVIIGHVKSEKFKLNLTKSDKMHVHVQQVDSDTAELYLDSNFCTNESSLEINLNLAKNGTIRYGNRKPIHIGPVFTRVHMHKQSCDREQPLTLFFDLCERLNPCSSGGTCVSVMPDYNDASYVPSETGHVDYKCHCPLHTSGEHCQNLRYPLGYCLNGGTLLQILDRLNRSIETCLCPLGFHGEHCEENIDNCLGIDCSGHGLCEDGIETYRCSCYDGFYGFHCERTNVQTVLLQAASRSFGVIAILLIAAIAGLVVTSDIHTYLTRKQQRNSLWNKLPRVTSELFENSVLLLGFGDAPIEMNDLSIAGREKKPLPSKPRQARRITRYRRPITRRQMMIRRPLTAFPKPSSRR